MIIIHHPFHSSSLCCCPPNRCGKLGGFTSYRANMTLFPGHSALSTAKPPKLTLKIDKVSVPCSSLFKIVTVRCGHCTNLLSVNMGGLLQPLPYQAPTGQQNQSFNSYDHHRKDSASSSTCSEAAMISYAENEEARTLSTRHVPEKRQRVPSAYNRFIKEEIQRIKACHPEITHREAFSTAAKNWAHFPHIHFGLMLENHKQAKIADEDGDHDVLNGAEAVCNK